MPFIYVNYLYLAHSEMISETKYVHPMWHTNFIFQKQFFGEKISVVGPVCRVGAHTLSHYTILSGSDMVLLSV